MMRVFVHMLILAVVGAVTLMTATPADSAESASAAVVAALEKAISVPGARLDGASEERGPGRGCVAREVTIPRAVDGSGRIPVKVVGTRGGGNRCEAWSWVRVRLVADVAVTRHAVRVGERLADAVAVETREIVSGHSPVTAASLSDGAVASRALVAGAVVEADDATVATARPGDVVKVMIIAGALAIEQSGRAIPCARGRSCAMLPSGKHVEGELVDGRLVVTLP
jgi:hypothetical protein